MGDQPPSVSSSSEEKKESDVEDASPCSVQEQRADFYRFCSVEWRLRLLTILADEKLYTQQECFDRLQDKCPSEAAMRKALHALLQMSCVLRVISQDGSQHYVLHPRTVQHMNAITRFAQKRQNSQCADSDMQAVSHVTDDTES